jgi:hypothetical protein
MHRVEGRPCTALRECTVLKVLTFPPAPAPTGDKAAKHVSYMSARIGQVVRQRAAYTFLYVLSAAGNGSFVELSLGITCTASKVGLVQLSVSVLFSRS